MGAFSSGAPEPPALLLEWPLQPPTDSDIEAKASDTRPKSSASPCAAKVPPPSPPLRYYQPGTRRALGVVRVPSPS